MQNIVAYTVFKQIKMRFATEHRDSVLQILMKVDNSTLLEVQQFFDKKNLKHNISYQRQINVIFKKHFKKHRFLFVFLIAIAGIAGIVGLLAILHEFYSILPENSNIILQIIGFLFGFLFFVNYYIITLVYGSSVNREIFQYHYTLFMKLIDGSPL